MLKKEQTVKKDRHNLFIVPEGLLFVIPSFILACLSFFFAYRAMGFLLLIFSLFILWFFRNPERKVPEEAGVVSPADGRVVEITQVTMTDLINGKFTKIGIFMNVFNVHVNRVPYAGKVKSIVYKKGRFFAANNDKATLLNEQNAIVIDIGQGQELLTVQIAGLIARRIVCWLEEGMAVSRGERMGLICFGSRLDVYFPKTFQLKVSIGDKVVAGETIIGVVE